MQRTFLAKFIGISALTLGLAVLPSSLSEPAQATATDPAVDPASPTVTDTQVYAEDDGFDWGWLGLLGLIGLAGLARKSDDSVARYREPDEVSSTNPRY